jgi:hypothetical protein
VDIIEQLLDQPGLYVGVDHGRHGDGAARLLVTPLPGRAGVALDYEIFHMADPAMGGHAEHSVLGRTEGGGSVLVVADIHGATLGLLAETEPGTFERPLVPGPYPMKVVVSVPEPGRLRYAWWYGSPGEEPEERDVGELIRRP